MRLTTLLMPAALLASVTACTGSSVTPASEPRVHFEVSDAYELAGEQPLPEREPEEFPDLHNVYRLSEQIISGSEPHSDEAFATIAAMGVKTIVSVDGKSPDAEGASRHGMRYVHVPIRYSGISEDELLRLSKTFRELDGPFFVHCFHGRHRGPAAAAVGRLVVDGASREEALAEMRQWCGTSAKYDGLYASVASSELPTGEETEQLSWDFPAAQPMAGFREAMVGVSRAHDHLTALAEAGWEVDPEHPDIDPVNEAEILHELYRRSSELEEVRSRPRDFQEQLAESIRAGEELLLALRAARAGEADAEGAARTALQLVGESCKSCHTAYRNH